MNLQTSPTPAVPVPAKMFERKLANGDYLIDEMGLQKRCIRCLDHWPADTEFFYASAKCTDGLSGWCKACYVEWKTHHPEKVRTSARLTKRGKA